MASSTIFTDQEEISRLVVQNSLLKEYEQPIYQRVISSGRDLRLLDIGCNNGSKTVERFSGENIAKVIGLEFHEGLAKQAQETHGNETFAFYQCDVEEPAFAGRLTALMEQNGVAAFDIIHMSFVLMHLKDPAALLTLLRGFLAPGGRLIVVEADDGVSEISPDPNCLFQEFLEILALDPFSGDRNFGAKVPVLLEKCGFQEIALENKLVEAAETQSQKKRQVFDTFFSYLPQDIRCLRRQEPHNAQYVSCETWLSQHYDTLQRLILSDNTRISMGISILTCCGE